MNIRKNIDYSEMYEELDLLMEKELSQMELYCGIGKAVCQRTEKGAAVMASEYLNNQYPDVKGFSPRSLRRMRDFYRTYENHPVLLCRAMKLGWIQNVVIMEADLTMDLREWYMKAAKQFGWSKIELIANIAEYGKLIAFCIENDISVFRTYWDEREKGDRCYSIDWKEKRCYYSNRIYWEDSGYDIITPKFYVNKYGIYKMESESNG